MNNLDVLRAVAILAVVAHHLAHSYHFNIPFFHQHGGWFGVQLFFLLSGYLIIQSADKYSLKSYSVHRLLRIFPAYLIIYLSFGFYGGVLTLQRILEQPIDFILNLTLFQHFSVTALRDLNVLNVTWTLTIEVCWYVCAIFLVKPIKRFPNTMLLLSFVISTLWTWLATHHYLDAYFFIQPDDWKRHLFLNNAFPAQFSFFVLGAYIYFKQDVLTKQNALMLGLVAVIILSSWFEMVHLLTNPNLISGIGLGALVVLGLQAPTFYAPVLKWIADISYSIYLIHFSVLLYSYNNLNWKNHTGMLGAFALMFIIASLSYYLIEKPSMKLARKLTK
jgi:peptidoglycan/LPS O-acetylase OafA/YrhL